jgi:hypothetical protein
MGKIIRIQVHQSRLPRRLLKDGWWLESPPARSTIADFPKRRTPEPKPRTGHLTLVRIGK